MAAHFKIIARLDAPALTSGVVTIERVRGLFTVRPFRRRRTYELPLAVVADMVVARVIRAEVQEKRAARKAKRLTGRSKSG